MTIKKIKGNFKILGFKCVNCDKDIPWERLYKIFCSELCQEEAKYVRYHRKVIAEGRDKDPDIAAAIEVKRISIISGGYSTKDRKVPESLRAQVFKLSKNRCAICGKLGREVDHIKGSSNDIENLQLLCWDCHIAKTMQNHKLIKYSDPRLLDVILKNTELDKRVKRKKPFKICDDSVLWRSRLKKVNDDRKISYFKNVADFIKKQKFSNDTGQFIANKLNELRIPTFSNLGAWDRKSVGIILKLIKGK